jgi:hypothetical protein
MAVPVAGRGQRVNRINLIPSCQQRRHHQAPVDLDPGGDDMVAHDSTRGIYSLNSAAAGRRVHELIREGIDAGLFRTIHAEFVGEAVGLIDGIQHGELLARTGLSSGDAFTELSDLVLSALTNKSG